MTKRTEKGKGVPNDQIADMLTRLRNAQLAKHKTVKVRASTVTIALTRALIRAGFLSYGLGPALALNSLEIQQAGFFEVTLKRPFRAFNCVSSSSVRVYVYHEKIPAVLNKNEIGINILLTFKGMCTIDEAYEQRLGGELICYVW
jgi:small subunit ribosomal protein S8